jgi:hypothetical protein
VTELAAVLDVVVDEGEVVHELDRRGRRHRSPHLATERVADEEQQRWSEELAAGVRLLRLLRPTKVVADELVHRRVRSGCGGAGEAGLHLLEDCRPVASEERDARLQVGSG